MNRFRCAECIEGEREVERAGIRKNKVCLFSDINHILTAWRADQASLERTKYAMNECFLDTEATSSRLMLERRASLDVLRRALPRAPPSFVWVGPDWLGRACMAVMTDSASHSNHVSVFYGYHCLSSCSFRLKLVGACLVKIKSEAAKFFWTKLDFH